MLEFASQFLVNLGTFVLYLPILLFAIDLLVKLEKEYNIRFTCNNSQSTLTPSKQNDFYSQVKDLFHSGNYEPTRELENISDSASVTHHKLHHFLTEAV